MPEEMAGQKYRFVTETYTGEFLDNKFNGKGKYLYADGAEYEGEWSKSELQGKGKLTFPGILRGKINIDGKEIEGDFQKDVIITTEGQELKIPSKYLTEGNSFEAEGEEGQSSSKNS